MAKTTALASGTNRYFAVPPRKNIGTKTMQMHSVETKAGTAIWCAPSRIASFSDRWFPSSRLRSMFSIVDGGVVDQDAHRQREAAERHDVDGLAQRAQDDERAEDRERDGNRDDQRVPPAPEEEQNHRGGQQRRR